MAGVSAIEIKATGATVRPVLPDTRPSVAVIVVVPTATVETSPWDPPVFEIVATPVSEDDHVTVVVRFCVEASL